MNKFLWWVLVVLVIPLAQGVDDMIVNEKLEKPELGPTELKYTTRTKSLTDMGIKVDIRENPKLPVIVNGEDPLDIEMAIEELSIQVMKNKPSSEELLEELEELKELKNKLGL